MNLKKSYGFKAGDNVQLKNDESPTMTVGYFAKSKNSDMIMVRCYWFINANSDHPEMREYEFSPHALKKV